MSESSSACLKLPSVEGGMHKKDWDMKSRLCIVLLVISFSMPASGSDSSNFALVTLGNGVWAAIAKEGGKAGGNAGFVVGDDGVAVIDTFEDPAAAVELLAKIREITKLPIKFVVNTHYHLDHVNGNDVFAGAGAIVLAQRNVGLWIRTENLHLFGEHIPPALKARIESLPLPDVTYDEGVDLHLGRDLQVRYYPGHTGGDSIVVVSGAGIVFCGDLLWKDHFPNLIDASTGQWISTLEKFQANYGSFTLIPGHGDIARAEDLAAFKNYLIDLRATVQKAMADGKSGDALVDAVRPGLLSKYGKWAWSEDFARSNILQTAEEIAGTKRVPTVPATK
jgi:cyclase